jgi:hypothetical protein
VKCWEVSKAKKYLARIECEGMEKAAEPLWVCAEDVEIVNSLHGANASLYVLQ